METAFFAFIAAAMLVPGYFAVRNANLIHAALWLGASLLATAGMYAMLGASFLAGVQVLVYVGGIVTLMLFGVMMTRTHEGLVAPAESQNTARAAAVAVTLFAVIAQAINRTDGLDTPLTSPDRNDVAELGRALVVDHVLAFEALSVLLLAAIVGAVVLARRREAPDRAQEVSP